ncbi:MAG: DNA-processing protein DprA [Pseudomonadota bacterium]
MAQPASAQSAPGAGALHDWLALLLAPGVGPLRLSALLAVHPEPASARQAPDSLLRELRFPSLAIRALREPEAARLDAALAWLDVPGHALLTRDDSRYPPALRDLPDAPVALFVSGEPARLREPLVGVVGSRHPTPGGIDNALAFSRHLAGLGLGIVSGLAQGVDAAAHEGALRAAGLTIAVLGTGPDIVYPAANRALAGRLLDAGGLLVSEFAPGTPPRREQFPRRNRIISGLALGVLVVEASVQSGSLITARLALEQGREVFAIPGSIHNPLARGCHALIRQGAKLVESAQDVLEELAPQLNVHPALAGGERPVSAPCHEAPDVPDPDYQNLLNAMGHDPVDIDTLIERSGLTAEVVSSMLLIMELDGRVHALPGGRVALRSYTEIRP